MFRFLSRLSDRLFRSFACAVCGKKVKPWDRNVRGDNVVRLVDYDVHRACRNGYLPVRVPQRHRVAEALSIQAIVELLTKQRPIPKLSYSNV